MDESTQFAVADLARMAAFIDGEGNIRLKSYKTRQRSGNYILRHEVKIAVTNTDIRLPAWCKATFGCGCIFISDSRSKFSGQKKAHRWEVGSKSAVQVIRAILPYLILKREQAEIALTFQDLLQTGRGSTPIPQENKTQRLELVNRVSKLNRRGA